MKRVRKTLKKYFIPHEENEHKPHILRPGTVAFVLLVAFVVESCLLFGSSYLAPRSRLFGIIVTNALVDETNQSRTTNHVASLTVSPLLQAAAQEKANDMATNNYFAHTSPSGLTPWYWFEQAGYEFTYAGENLAVNFSDSQDVTNAWMNSPEHRANILNGNFTQIGMATSQGTYEGRPAVYVVELFGAPVPPAPPAEPIAFINSASAAVSTSSSANIVKAPTVTAPKKKKIVQSTSTRIALAPTTSSQTFVAVKGAETQTVPATGTLLGMMTSSSATTTALAPSMGAAAGTILPHRQSNPIQNAAANPRQVVDYIYLAIILLFAVALGINVFMKIHLQHPQLILGGMLVVLVAGLLIVFNQHMLAGTIIL